MRQSFMAKQSNNFDSQQTWRNIKLWYSRIPYAVHDMVSYYVGPSATLWGLAYK